MAGIGFDADVVTRHHLARVGRSGSPRPTHRVAYVEPVLRSSLGYPFPPLTVRIDRPRQRGDADRHVGLRLQPPALRAGAAVRPLGPRRRRLARPRRLPQAGCVSRVVLPLAGPPGASTSTLPACTIGGCEVVVSSVEPVPVQLDGDPGGYVSTAGTARRRSWTDRSRVPRALDCARAGRVFG